MRVMRRKRLRSKKERDDIGILRKLLYNIITMDIISELYHIVLKYFNKRIRVKRELVKYFYEVIDPKISHVIHLKNILLSGLILPNCILTDMGVILDIIYISDTQQNESLFGLNINCNNYINVELLNSDQLKTKAAETLLNF